MGLQLAPYVLQCDTGVWKEIQIILLNQSSLLDLWHDTSYRDSNKSGNKDNDF